MDNIFMEHFEDISYNVLGKALVRLWTLGYTVYRKPFTVYREAHYFASSSTPSSEHGDFVEKSSLLCDPETRETDMGP